MVALIRPPDDFRQLSVIPEHKDLCIGVEPFLRPNVVTGRYPDVDAYLDIQFRLLREDFFRPLREGLQEFKNQVEGKAQCSKYRRIRLDNLRLYQDVRLVNCHTDRDEQTHYTLQFSGMKGIRWENSKRLIFGSLLMLSVDNFDTFLLFTVTGRNLKSLADENSITVRFEGSSQLPRYFWNNSMMMAESSVFFESYRSVLVALQKISPIHFPMKDYLLGHSVDATVPDYLVDKETVIAPISQSCKYLHSFHFYCRLFTT